MPHLNFKIAKFDKKKIIEAGSGDAYKNRMDIGMATRV